MGWPSIEWGKQVMGLQEYLRWQTYYMHEPWGQDWRQTALLCAVVANSTPGRKRPLKVDDFMPCGPPKAKQSDAAIANFFFSMFPPKDPGQKVVVEQIKEQMGIEDET